MEIEYRKLLDTIRNNLDTVSYDIETLASIDNILKRAKDVQDRTEWLENYVKEPMFITSYNTESYVFNAFIGGYNVYILICDGVLNTEDLIATFISNYKGFTRLLFCKDDTIRTSNVIWCTSMNKIRILKACESFCITKYHRRNPLEITGVFKAVQLILDAKKRNVFININVLRHTVNSQDLPEYIDSRNLLGRSICHFCLRDFKNTPKSRSFHKNNCVKIPDNVKGNKKFRDWYTVCTYENI